MMVRFEERLRAQGYQAICGVDEAGRGPLAGPVVAGAVILDWTHPIVGLNDSKQLSQATRERLFSEIKNHALAVGIGIVDQTTIDRINILEASRLAMMQAIRQLCIPPDAVLTDYMELPDLCVPVLALVHGDCRSASIAAGSIIAKVTRDRIMMEYASKYPEYGFYNHKGYPTKEHLAALKKWGPTPIHRLSFKPVKTLWNPQNNEGEQ